MTDYSETPLLNKIKPVENITLHENGKLVRHEKEVLMQIFLMIFCKYFPNLGINAEHDFLNTTNISHNPIENAISKYENHLSIIAVKEHMKGTNSSFTFKTATKENTSKLITNLDNRKAVQSITKLSNILGYPNKVS